MPKTEIEYLRIPNWDKYVERRTARGKPWTPPWVKVYAELDFRLSQLSLAQRGLLIEMHKLANRLDNRIPYSAPWISRAAMLSEDITSDLETLISSGLVSHYVAVTEQFRNGSDTVTEQLRDGLVQGESKKDPPPLGPLHPKKPEKERKPPTGSKERKNDIQRVGDYWLENRRAGRVARLTPSRRLKIAARLKSFSADELIRAITAVALDPWEDRSRHDDLTIIFRSDEQVEKFLALADDPGVLSHEDRQQRHLQSLKEKGL